VIRSVVAGGGGPTCGDWPEVETGPHVAQIHNVIALQSA
jgi:hypothetical protein